LTELNLGGAGGVAQGATVRTVRTLFFPESR